MKIVRTTQNIGTVFSTVFGTVFFSALIAASCAQQQPTAIGTVSSTASSSTTGSTTLTTPSDPFGHSRLASTVKVVFNKASFYNNFAVNGFGCAGDVESFFDPTTDRKTPFPPYWLRNVSVDITNSNALHGPSGAVSCSLTAAGSATASNCASFDDLQPLQGSTLRTLMVGGSNCAGCASPTNLKDTWTLITSDVASNIIWTQQTNDLSVINPNGLSWAAGDFDTLHNEFYMYGGAVPNGTGGSTFVNSLYEITFSSNGGVSAFQNVTSGIDPILSYGSWVKNSWQPALTLLAPPAMTGASLTYGLRRDPTFKSWCNGHDTTNCNTGGSTQFSARNEHSDYFLLLGGLKASGAINSKIYMYKPHSFSNDLTAVPGAPTNGDWNILSDVGGLGHILGQATVAADTTGTNLVSVTAATFPGLAYHKTTYDPGSNRFFIFGGLTGSAATPALNSNLWIYDPPALNRRPNIACYSSVTPDGVTLPVTSRGLASDGAFAAATTGMDVNLNYFTNRWVFPPGGCLQKIIPDAAALPQGRFEHSMAFNSDQKNMLMFGGCTSTAAIPTATTNPNAGDATASCGASSLLNDTWIYLAPTTNDYVPHTFTQAGTPYDTATGFHNIFGSDFWLNLFPLNLNNDPSQAAIITPTTQDVLGTWIQLSPTNTPQPRVSGQMFYDRGQHKYFLFGGFGCTTPTCTATTLLNDLWEFTPPDLSTCTRSTSTCTSQGSWTQIQTAGTASSTLPAARKGAVTAFAQPMFSFGDDFYTVLDSACSGQGPVNSGDSSVSKQNVGAVYIDLDRTYFADATSLLLNLRFMPFSSSTKLPGIYNPDPTNTISLTDSGSSNDTAIVRIQLMQNPTTTIEQLLSQLQPRFHEYISSSSSRVIADTFAYISGPSGQLTEKQLLIPLPIDASISMLKIERIQGSVKFYEMTLTKF